MNHDAVNDPHHVILLKAGDRLKARKTTSDLRAGDLYEVTRFRDVPFPNQHHSTTVLLNVTTGKPIGVSTGVMQSGFRNGSWALA